jgi:phage host-nuclease inhibitor protein Gam
VNEPSKRSQALKRGSTADRGEFLDSGTTVTLNLQFMLLSWLLEPSEGDVEAVESLLDV